MKRLPCVLVFFVGAVVTVPVLAANTDPVRATAYITVIAASTPESPCNDTATVAELPDGMLMVVWHKYRASSAGTSDFGLADIAGKVSTDGGRSWKDERRLVEMTPGDVNIQAPAICVLPHGKLLMAALRAHARDSSSMCLFRSKDLGRTWQSAGELWSHSSGQWLQGGAPSIVRLADGRLVLPYHGGTGDQGGQHNSVSCYVSDDDGHTWRRPSAVIDLPMRGAMEASVAQLADGRLLMSLRTQLGTVMLCESRDRVEMWSLPWSAGLTAPESCACLRRIGASNRLLLIWNGCEFYEPKHHHFGQRNPLTLAISDDAGRTWRRLGNLENDPNFTFTNINCTFTAKGDAVITYFRASPPWAKTPDRSELCSALLPKSFWATLP
jgi:sialidase-1